MLLRSSDMQKINKLIGWRLAGLVVTAFAVLGLTACSHETAKGAQAAPQGLPVKLQVAQSEAVGITSDYVATLRSRESAIIMPEVEGRITHILVHSGDHVAAGARLIQIDPSKQQATVSSQEQSRVAQEATLAYAQQQFDRSQGLYDAKVVSKQDLDQAKSNLDNARAQLKSLDAQVSEQQVQLRYYTAIATNAGIVGDIPVRVGDRVSTTTQLTTVDQPGDLEAYIYVPIERSGDLKMNMPVQIVDSEGKPVADSRISFISPEVDPTTQSVLVKAKIANHQDRLRQSQFIRARVIWGSQQNTVVPILAVTRLGGEYFAFIAEDQGGGKYIAHQRPLKIGETVGNNLQVLDGIKPGDKIIVTGTQFLVDGMPVIPQG